MDQIIELWVQAIQNTHPAPNKLLQKQSLTRHLFRDLELFKKRLLKGRTHLLEELEFSEDVKRNLQNPKWVKQAFEEGKPLFNMLGFTEVQMKSLYKKASDLFYAQEYEKSSDAFYFLTTLNPSHPHYWLGLALSEQSNGETHTALTAYGMAILYDAENPLPYYQSARLYLDLDDNESAIASLKLALSFAENNPPLKQKCHKLLGKLQ